MKESSKPPLKGFMLSKEGRHEALAIDEKGCDPKAFKLLIKTGYDPKEKLSLGKLPLEATGKKLHGLNATQIMLKEKGHAIQDSQVVGFTPPKPVRIAIKRVNSNYVSERFSLTEDHNREENLGEYVFNRLGPHRKELHGITNRQSVFDRLGPCKRVGHQKKCAFKGTVRLKKNIKSSHTQKLRSLIPSKMKRQIILTVSCGRVLKAKAQTVIFSQVQSDDEDDKESLVSSIYISNGAEEDAEDAPAELEEGIKTTIDELKEVNLGDIENPRSIYISVSLTQEEEGTYIALLHEFKDVFAWSYKKMPGLDLKRGIEIEQAKIDAILRMPKLRNIHELKSLQGKLAYLRRFISNLAGHCQPFSRLMKKDVSFQWDETCDKAFKSIKSYLVKPPVLVAPVPGRPLILYIAAQEHSVGILFAQKNDEGKKNALH
ncbi:hypothetical protein Sango_0252800 [Sesamum angolense]|uniref:Reverse transcriptase/retrotransposon-derived protein RNase H-like domain-containing protein n=1 Tax=Sesamum angolense TaxID=2727404 RepID=A0AAE2C7F2_9LAMI|nr:hypothetical protein Sango_0252800 [Sesamum angolense]